MKYKFPVFNTSRLILREPKLENAASYKKYFVDYEVIGQLAATAPWPYPEGGVIDYISNHIIPNQGKDRWSWGIFLSEDPTELIGCVELMRNTNPSNRGFWLGKKFWGIGYMTEAVFPVMNFAFDALGFKKLLFTNASGNIRSSRIKEKTGAKFLGRGPAKYANPNYTEQELWELSKEDWKKFNGCLS